MKILKIILSLCIAISLTSCSDSDPKITTLDFSVANVAGNYNLKTFTADIENTAVTQGVISTISTAKQVGDTFNLTLKLNTNGTFTLTGNYRVVTTVTPTGGTPTTNPEIIIVDDSGNYTVNSQTRTITFTSSNNQLLDEQYKVLVFNETTFSLSQKATDVDGGITTTTDAIIVFDKE